MPEAKFYEEVKDNTLGVTPQTPLIDSYIDQVRQKSKIHQIEEHYFKDNGEILVSFFDTKESKQK